MIKVSILKILPFALIPISISSLRAYANIPLGTTAMWWVIQIAILFMLLWGVRYSLISYDDKKSMRIVKWYLIWNLISIVRGIFMAEIYWDYKGLISMGMALLLPLVAYIALDKDIVQSILSVFIKITLPLFVIFIPFINSGGWGWYFPPIAFLMLFFPTLPLKGKVIALLISAIAMLADVGTRSHVIKYGFPILLVFFFYTSKDFAVSRKIIEITRKVLILLPIILFLLAATGVFNVFKMNEYIEGEYVSTKKDSEGEVQQTNLTTDTRTFLFQEVIYSAIKYDYWLIGRSPARGNETIWFAKETEEISGRPERLRNEVAILNIFTWTGLVGLIMYFIIFYKASYLATKYSKNIYGKLIGLFIAFRWAYGWVEDYNAFDMNNFVIWLMVGVCFSSSFRNMTNAEVQLWAWGIFGHSYRNKYKLYNSRLT